MALGKAVVANDHPEQKPIIENSGGGICVPFSETEFAKAIILLLNNPALREKMGTRGKDWVMKNRIYTKIADQVEDRFYRCMGA